MTGRRATLAHNEAQIVKYLEHIWPLIEKGLVMPEEPPDRKARGSSRSTLTDWGERLIWTNRVVTAVLEPIIQEAKRSEAKLYGHAFSSLITETTDDPMAVQYFRNHRGERRSEAFFGMCHLFALAVGAAHDGPGGPCRLRVYLRPENEEEEASLAEQRADPNHLGYGSARSYTAHDSYRRMVEDMERLVLAGTHSKEGAKAHKADELMCSMGRVRAAITFVNRERETVFSGNLGEVA